MELGQRAENHETSTARLLSEMERLSRSNRNRVSEIESQRPEILRKFLEGFVSNRGGSIV
jgi:hypothetical protein